MAGHGLL
jgi:deazaflavin-dependent oxidoreductase (nitroreductase family)